MKDGLPPCGRVAAVGLVPVGMLLAACASAQGSPGQSFNEFSPLLDDSRTHLSICVDGAGGVEVTEEDADVVQRSLESGLAEVDDLPPEYAEREIVVGCPPPAELLGAPQEERGQHVPNVEKASEHRLHLYFLPPDIYDATFPGGKPYTRTVEEEVFRGDQALPATEGLYVPFPASPDAIREGLLLQLRLIRADQTPQPTIDWCACERGEDPAAPYWTCDNPYTEEQCDDWKQDQWGQ